MALRFDKRVVLVTGGARGMGRAHCLELARRGARLVVNDLGGRMTGEGADASVAAAVVAEIHAAGGEAVSCIADVATEVGASEIISTAIGAFGRVDAIVHNARMVGFAPIEAMSIEQKLKRIVDGDPNGPFGDAAEFLDMRHANSVAAGATLGKASVTEAAS